MENAAQFAQNLKLLEDKGITFDLQLVVQVRDVLRPSAKPKVLSRLRLSSAEILIFKESLARILAVERRNRQKELDKAFDSLQNFLSDEPKDS